MINVIRIITGFLEENCYIFHNGIDALEQGLFLIDAGHYGLEKIFVPYMKTAILREIPEVKVVCASETSPFHIL